MRWPYNAWCPYNGQTSVKNIVTCCEIFLRVFDHFKDREKRERILI